MFVDRFISTPMFYPCNYGFVPETLADDGDPADVLVVTPYPSPVSKSLPTSYLW
jgi:inorganic pyrophosphatase